MIKKEYVVHIRYLKQALNHGPILKKLHKIAQFNQEAWLKLCIEVNTELKTKGKRRFSKRFFQVNE